MKPRIAVVLGMIFGLLGGSALAAQSPTADGLFSVEMSESAYQIVWSQQAELLDDGSGSGPIWAPISLRLYLTNDMNIAAEIQNTSEVPLPGPMLNLTLLSEGQSLGTESFSAENEWVDAGSSAFYQTLGVFGGSLFIGDWDEVQLSIEPNPYRTPDMEAYAGIAVEGEQITNQGTETLGTIYFIAVLRDSAEVYTASCGGPYTGANILPGKSVRARGLGDHSNPGGCGFTLEGEKASESLGIGGPYTEEHIISSIQDPE